MPARRGNVGDPTTRNSLLDSAHRIMLADGYAAATTRRIAQEAGVNSALVSYYFGSRDAMFVELFQRGAERSFARLEAAFHTVQPLWSFWDLIRDPSSSASTMEFIALANHRPAIKEVIAASSRRFRAAHVAGLTEVLRGHGVDPDDWPASVVVLTLASISRFLTIEESFGVDVGHEETVATVERMIRSLEGERRSHP